jgi:hypothetical protein
VAGFTSATMFLAIGVALAVLQGSFSAVVEQPVDQAEHHRF